MILLTGASGFIGSHLAHALVDKRKKLILVSRKGKFDPALLKIKNKVTALKLDITKRSALEKLPGPIEAIFHTAIHPSQKPETDFDLRQCIETNALGTLNLLEFCQKRGIERFIYSSSIGVYGNKISPPIDESYPIIPKTAYGIGKYLGEMYCKQFHQNHGIQHFILRYSSVYGYNQAPDTVLPIFINLARNNRDIVIFGQGKKIQDFVYIKDVIKANLLALKSKHPGDYLIGAGIGTSMLTLAKTVSQVFGGGGKARILRNRELPGDSAQIWLNVSKAKQGLGYAPDFSLERGLRDYKSILDGIR